MTNNDSKVSRVGGLKHGKPERSVPLATVREVFSLIDSAMTLLYLLLGGLCAIVAGIARPASLLYFSSGLREVSAVNEEGIGPVLEVVYSMMILGVVSLISETLEVAFFETAATGMTVNLKRKWFEAVVRQDITYFDLTEVARTSTIISTNGAIFKKGLAEKLGRGVQSTCTVLAEFGVAFYFSWQVSLAVIATIPAIATAAVIVMKLNQSKSARDSASYADAGKIVYQVASNIRTVLALNAAAEMTDRFTRATEAAYDSAVSIVLYLGLAHGTLMAAFKLAYMVTVGYGSSWLSRDVRENGCDPSGAISGNPACALTGKDLIIALMAVIFAGATIPQISAALEAFAGAQAACFPAVKAMSRKSPTGNPRLDEANTKEREALERRAKEYHLPQNIIDIFSPLGKKPETITGTIQFHNVGFSYPTRSEVPVFNGFNLKIEAGKTVALVGPSGSGKSTAIQMIERFYDPVFGKITLDDVDIHELNVHWLRKQIGLVGQEPTLFATTIKENIRIAKPDATDEEIKAAARQANAHDFIVTLQNGYDTHVGDQGTQLSGGQKQRIAIARTLITGPKVILMDEATSALDSESEAVVQEALDAIMAQGNVTVVVIAHRLSTIKNADFIAVVEKGKVAESGTHDELLSKKGRYFTMVQAQKGMDVKDEDSLITLETLSATSDSDALSRDSSEVDLSTMDRTQRNEQNSIPAEAIVALQDVHFSYPARPDNAIFRGLGIDVNEGETLAIVGPSGQGKSTVIQIIEEFYHPSKGDVKYNGDDLRDLNVHWYRNEIALVSQEPTLFDGSIAENIKFGMPEATHAQIEEAAKVANAHVFITEFPEGYNTCVGTSSSALISGGQKQRIAIARALLRKPKVLLLDEATSALDSESEKVVQKALDNIMSDSKLVTVVIAHRLSTIRGATKIAYIDKGKVREIGSYEELMAKPDGLYKRLEALQTLDEGIDLKNILGNKIVYGSVVQPLPTKHGNKGNEEGKMKRKVAWEYDQELVKLCTQKAQQLARGEIPLLMYGGIGAMLNGITYPGQGFVFAYLIEIFYQVTLPCDGDENVPGGFETCQDYWDMIADDIKKQSFKTLYLLVGLIVFSLVGNIIMFQGFGTATERINKRVRDMAFKALIRQEVAWYDLRTVGEITSQLSDDAAMIHSFSGEPVRTLMMSISSVGAGLAVSIYFMWEIAFITVGILPFMVIGEYLRTQQERGSDEGDLKKIATASSEGAIVVETFANIRTVASLCLEGQCLDRYTRALLEKSKNGTLARNIFSGMHQGLSSFFQMFGYALMFYFGGWCVINRNYETRDFFMAVFGLMVSLPGLAAAISGLTDANEAKAAAVRIFELIERTSEIDPLSNEGKKQLVSGREV